MKKVSIEFLYENLLSTQLDSKRAVQCLIARILVKSKKVSCNASNCDWCPLSTYHNTACLLQEELKSFDLVLTKEPILKYLVRKFPHLLLKGKL